MKFLRVVVRGRHGLFNGMEDGGAPSAVDVSQWICDLEARALRAEHQAELRRQELDKVGKQVAALTERLDAPPLTEFRKALGLDNYKAPEQVLATAQGIRQERDDLGKAYRDLERRFADTVSECNLLRETCEEQGVEIDRLRAKLSPGGAPERVQGPPPVEPPVGMTYMELDTGKLVAVGSPATVCLRDPDCVLAPGHAGGCEDTDGRPLNPSVGVTVTDLDTGKPLAAWETSEDGTHAPVPVEPPVTPSAPVPSDDDMPF